MVDITAFAKRIRKRTIAATSLFFGGSFMMVLDFTTRFPTQEKGEFALVWAFVMAVGVYFWYRSMELPLKEIMQLAESRNGLLTLSEAATALDVDPDRVADSLHCLERRGLAKPCWQELNKNLWEFPDSMHLPIAQTIDLARSHGGRVNLQDLVASGQSLELAQQTFSVLAEKGLAREERAEGRSLVFEMQ